MMHGGENILSNRTEKKPFDDFNAGHLGDGEFGVG